MTPGNLEEATQLQGGEGWSRAQTCLEMWRTKALEAVNKGRR